MERDLGVDAHVEQRRFELSRVGNSTRIETTTDCHLQQMAQSTQTRKITVYVKDVGLFVTVQLLEALRQSCLLVNSARIMGIPTSGLKVRNHTENSLRAHNRSRSPKKHHRNQALHDVNSLQDSH